MNSIDYLFFSDRRMAPSISWSPVRAKVQLKLGIQRLRLLAAKKAQLAKVTRREIAGLLEKGKLETARIKVEGVMGEDSTVELLELLELYCELLLARFGLLELPGEIEGGISEAVIGIIHAAPRSVSRCPASHAHSRYALQN